MLNEIAGNSNTNHQAIIEFKDKWYFIYHNSALVPDAGSFHRSVCIDYLYYNPDGTMKRVVMTSEGVRSANDKSKGAFRPLTQAFSLYFRQDCTGYRIACYDRTL